MAAILFLLESARTLIDEDNDRKWTKHINRSLAKWICRWSTDIERWSVLLNWGNAV